MRPSYVPSTFPGRCKVFPPTEAMLLAYQEKWVLDNSIMKLMEKGRRIEREGFYETAFYRDGDLAVVTWSDSRGEKSSWMVVPSEREVLETRKM